MSRKIYSSDDSLNQVLYEEMQAKARANPEQGLPVEEIKARLAASFQVSLGEKRDYHPVQKITFDEIQLVQKARSAFGQIAGSLDRLQQLGVDALRNITTDERLQLDEEYQYLKRLIQAVGEETKIGSKPLLDVDPETMMFRLAPAARPALGANQFLFAQNRASFSEEELEDYEPEEDGPLHSVTSGVAAANSLNVLKQGQQVLTELNSSLNAVEGRLLSKIKKFVLDETAGSVIGTLNGAANLALDVTNQIFTEAESALDVHSSFSVRDLESMFL